MTLPITAARYHVFCSGLSLYHHIRRPLSRVQAQPLVDKVLHRQTASKQSLKPVDRFGHKATRQSGNRGAKPIDKEEFEKGRFLHTYQACIDDLKTVMFLVLCQTSELPIQTPGDMYTKELQPAVERLLGEAGMTLADFHKLQRVELLKGHAITDEPPKDWETALQELENEVCKVPVEVLELEAVPALKNALQYMLRYDEKRKTWYPEWYQNIGKMSKLSTVSS